VRRVRDEPAQALLRGLAGGERLLEPVEHAVQGDAQPSHLAARIGGAHAMREVAAGDRGRGVAHAVQGQQPDPHHRPGEQPDQDQDAGDHDGLDDQQPMQVLVDGAQGHRHDRGQPAVAHRGGQHAVAARVHGPSERRPRGQRRRRAVLDGPEEAARQHVAAPVAQLAVGVRRRRAAGRWAPVVRAVAVIVVVAAQLARQLGGQRERGVRELRVHAREQERALVSVRRAAHDQHPQRRQHEHAGDEAPAQRRDHVRGGRSA
jgi:hypothetical protein